MRGWVLVAPLLVGLFGGCTTPAQPGCHRGLRRLLYLLASCWMSWTAVRARLDLAEPIEDTGGEP